MKEGSTMNFVRKVIHSNMLEHIVDLPEDLRNQDVELIILPLRNPISNQASAVGPPSARGALKQFSNPELLQYEQEAWKKSLQ